MPNISSLTSLSASDIARMVNRKEVSPVEVVEAHLARIDKFNPEINAFCHIDYEGARIQARKAEQMARSGGELPPLLGVPVTVKSCIDVAGLSCEAGSRLRAGHVPAQDATLVARLRHAGAILLGNTSTPEALMAYHTDNDLQGRTNNPWDLRRTPGGSSGGEAGLSRCRPRAESRHGAGSLPEADRGQRAKEATKPGGAETVVASRT